MTKKDRPASRHDLKMSRPPSNDYGSLAQMVPDLRDHRPLDLTAERWRQVHPNGNFEAWRQVAHQCLSAGLHYDPGPLDLQAEVRDRVDRSDYILERVAFNTTPWIRVNGYFLLPKGVTYPVPGLVVFHAWGGPIIFGKERIVNTGRDHPALEAHRQEYYSGRYLAEEFAKRGYAVIVIDAYHFGERSPRGLNGIPTTYDAFELSSEAFAEMSVLVASQIYLGVRQLNWAGTTWTGLNFWDDSRCVDYLCSRPEVDAARIGCTGLSGGGWRTNMLAALDRRIKASVSGCWMTTGDYQQIYNLHGAIGTFCLLPGVWDRLDVPDLTILTAPNASMVVSNSEDLLFPQEAQQEADRQTRLGYAWAGCPEQYAFYNPVKLHCYDAEVQQEALAWVDRHRRVG